MSVSRFDYLGTANSFEKTAQGFLRVKANLSRTGVFPYSYGTHTVHELRTPGEVFRADSLKSLKGAPVTDLHPLEHGKTPFVSAANAKELSIGIAEDITQDGQYLTGSLLIYDAAAIAAIETGERKEISLGYNCDLEATPGVFKGQRYDAVQKNIVVNHIALGPVGWGRAGRECAIRMDSNIAYQIMEEEQLSDKQTINLDGLDIELSPQSVHALLDKKTQEFKNLQGRFDALSIELKNEQQRRMDAEDPVAVDSKVKDRMTLLQQCQAILGADADLDGKSDKELKIAVIKSFNPELNVDDQDDSYIEGMFQAIVSLQNKETRNDSLGRAHIAVKKAGTINPISSREKWLADSAALYKKPLSGSLRGAA